MDIELNKSDVIGAFASGLCMIHCIATPLLFVVQSCSVDKHCCDGAPSWWSMLDYVFLAISCVAIFQSTKTSTNSTIKIMLWVLWGVLAFLLTNEKFGFLPLPEFITYIIATVLSALHIYNLRYCQCKNDSCCMNA